MDHRTRLLAAAERILLSGSATLSLEVVAADAELSRATAYRYFRGRDDLLIAVAVEHSQRVNTGVIDAIAPFQSAVRKVEEAAVYLCRALPGDPLVAGMIDLGLAVIDNSRVWGAAVDFLEPIVARGREQGELRVDVGIEDLIHWIAEQLLLTVKQNPDEPTIRSRFQTFLAPSIEAHPTPGAPVEPIVSLRLLALQVADIAREIETSIGGNLKQAGGE